MELEDALQRESVGAVWYLDDIGMKTALMVNPSVIRRYLFPYMKIIGARCRQRGIPFIYHTDGNIESVIPELCKIGVCALHPLEPLAMDIRQVKRQYGEELSLIGGIDLSTDQGHRNKAILETLYSCCCSTSSSSPQQLQQKLFKTKTS